MKKTLPVIPTVFVWLMSLVLVWAITGREEICVHPTSVKLSSQWLPGDCVASKTVKGIPIDGWYQIIGKTDNGDWYGYWFNEEGKEISDTAYIGKITNKKISCPELKEELP